MPKVSDYELDHFGDEEFESKQKFHKKTRPAKEKKYSDKKDYRTD